MHWSLDDWEQYAYLPEPPIGTVIESPRKVLEMWRAELDGMRHYRCLFNLCVHPFPVRAAALADSAIRTTRLPDVTADPAVYPE